MDQMSAKMYTPSIKSLDTKASKAIEFYPMHLNHAFMTTPDFEGYRRNAKEQYVNATNHFGKNPDFLKEDLHQMSDHLNTFARTAVNDERRQVLNPRVIWDGSFD
jgi:hypothetical protein